MLLLQRCKGGQQGWQGRTHPLPRSFLLAPSPAAFTAMVKSSLGAEPDSAAGSRAASSAQQGQLLAPKRLHLRSGPCDCISSSSWELVLLKGSPVSAVEQSWILFLLLFLWHPRGESAHPGACLPRSEDGLYCRDPYAKHLSKIRQLLPNGRQVPSSAPPEEEPLLTMLAQ